MKSQFHFKLITTNLKNEPTVKNFSLDDIKMKSRIRQGSNAADIVNTMGFPFQIKFELFSVNKDDVVQILLEDETSGKQIAALFDDIWEDLKVV